MSARGLRRLATLAPLASLLLSTACYNYSCRRPNTLELEVTRGGATETRTFESEFGVAVTDLEGNIGVDFKNGAVGVGAEGAQVILLPPVLPGERGLFDFVYEDIDLFRPSPDVVKATVTEVRVTGSGNQPIEVFGTVTGTIPTDDGDVEVSGAWNAHPLCADDDVGVGHPHLCGQPAPPDDTTLTLPDADLLCASALTERFVAGTAGAFRGGAMSFGGEDLPCVNTTFREEGSRVLCGRTATVDVDGCTWTTTAWGAPDPNTGFLIVNAAEAEPCGDDGRTSCFDLLPFVAP